MRPVRLTSIPLALLAATLVLASAAAAQTPTPEPCQAFNPCTRVIGPWVTAPSDLNQLFQIQCPAGTTAVSGDAAFPGAIYPVGIVTAGGLGPGGSSLEFAAFPDPRAVTFKPAVGCSPPGAKLAPLGRAAASPTRHRVRVRTARVRPGAAVRVRLACPRGTRLLHSGSSVAFYTPRPPPARVVKALEHRHRRGGRATRTVVVAPAGVGDDERVEVQVTAICAPARDRVAARLQGRTPQPCQTVEPCTPVVGPWVTAPSNGDSIYTVSCPDGQFAVGSDARFPGAIGPVAIETGGGLVAGRVDEFLFGVLSVPFSVTYQPAVGCSAPGAALPSFARAAGARVRYRVRRRTVRIRPGAAVRVRLGCVRGRRLVHSGSGVAFFTRRPPSSRAVRALEHRHRRDGRVTRTLVVAPAGVGDDERVEVQVTAVCAPAATPASAATPIGGSPYVSDPYVFTGRSQAAARLAVSQDGRFLVPRRGTFVSAYSRCPDGREGGAKVDLSSPARIRGDGRFGLVERQGKTALRLRGRFTRRWSARLVVKLRTPGFCRARPIVLKLRHVGDVPFRDCRTHPGEPVVRSPGSRVFLHRRGPGLFPVERAYGCLYSAGRRFSLGAPDRDGSGGPILFRLAGPYAGFVQVSCAAACGYAVNVKDLRDGATVRRLCCQLGVTDLVISPAAAFAFIGDPDDGPPEVVAVSGASSSVLDSGAGIGRTSLRLEGNALSWTKDGALREVSLE